MEDERYILVRYRYGKLPYLSVVFSLFNCIFLGLNAYYQFGPTIYLILVCPFIPFFILSLKSIKEKYKFGIGINSITIGQNSIDSGSICKVTIQKPSYLDITVKQENHNKTKAIHLQTNRENMIDMEKNIEQWARNKDITFEIKY